MLRKHMGTLLFVVFAGLAVALATMFFFPRGISYRLLFFVCTLCGIVSLGFATWRRERDPLRVAGFLVGAGSLMLAVSLLPIRWLDTRWLTLAGIALMIVGGLRGKVHVDPPDRQRSGVD